MFIHFDSKETLFSCNNICKHKFRLLPWLKFSFCFGLFQWKTRVTLDGLTFRFCSDTCFIQYHKANNFPEIFCNMCCSVCSDKPLVLKDDDGIKIICSDKCLVMFKEVNNLIVKIKFIKYTLQIKFNYDVEFSLFYASKLLHTLSGFKIQWEKAEIWPGGVYFLSLQRVKAPQPCLMCQTYHQISDMVENTDVEGTLKFFCSNRCMMVTNSLRPSPMPGTLSTILVWKAELLHGCILEPATSLFKHKMGGILLNILLNINLKNSSSLYYSCLFRT